MSALVLSVSRKEMTEKDKKCLHFTCGHGVLEGAVLIKEASPGGRRSQKAFSTLFSYTPFQAPSTHPLNQLSKPSSGIKWETGLFSFLTIFCFFNAYDSIKKNTQVVGK